MLAPVVLMKEGLYRIVRQDWLKDKDLRHVLECFHEGEWAPTFYGSLSSLNEMMEGFLQKAGAPVQLEMLEFTRIVNVLAG
jgi:hypothetical protein